MPVITNKYKDHQVSRSTEILFLGTFNPGIPGAPDFFYGRPRNFLWHLLPACWKIPSMKDTPFEQKETFMQKYKIDFADIIDAIDVPDGQEDSIEDDFIDSHVSGWKDLTGLIDTLPALKAVYFTRKTFNGIPRIKEQVSLVADHCRQKGIRFCKLDTPARHFSKEKQQQWVDTIILQKTCLRV